MGEERPEESMKLKCARVLFVLAVTLACLSGALAITIVDVKVACPICGTVNDFKDYASWGSYIYSFPSKFQLLFFPFTSTASIYSCRKCHLSLFIWDFKNFPKDKVEETKKLLTNVKLTGDYKTYTDIPASERLQIAEKVYRLLGRDDQFWSHFYRLLGYYCANEKKPEEAAKARRQALEITERMLANPENADHKKELLVIAGAMHHFLGDDPTALGELRLASTLTFHDKQAGAEKSKNYDEYLSALIKEYIPAIQAGRVPPDSGASD